MPVQFFPERISLDSKGQSIGEILIAIFGRLLVNKWPSYTISMSQVNSQDHPHMRREEQAESF
jgi:hypothetical protein